MGEGGRKGPELPSLCVSRGVGRPEGKQRAGRVSSGITGRGQASNDRVQGAARASHQTPSCVVRVDSGFEKVPPPTACWQQGRHRNERLGHRDHKGTGRQRRKRKGRNPETKPSPPACAHHTK